MNFQMGDNGMYFAEATVAGPYALHVEKEAPEEGKQGTFAIYQRSVDSGEYAPCYPVPRHVSMGASVIDWTFDHGVYPMNVRFESETEVTSATLTEGE